MKSLFITLVALFLCLTFNTSSFGDDGGSVVGDEPDNTENIFATITSATDIAAFLSNSHAAFILPDCLKDILKSDIHKVLISNGFKFVELRSEKGKQLSEANKLQGFDFYFTYAYDETQLMFHQSGESIYYLTGTITIMVPCDVIKKVAHIK